MDNLLQRIRFGVFRFEIWIENALGMGKGLAGKILLVKCNSKFILMLKVENCLKLPDYDSLRWNSTAHTRTDHILSGREIDLYYRLFDLWGIRCLLYSNLLMLVFTRKSGNFPWNHWFLLMRESPYTSSWGLFKLFSLLYI